MANPTEDIHEKLSKINYSEFFQYVVQVLEATNTPRITISRIEEKFRESPLDPIQYFERAIFFEFKVTDSNDLFDQLIRNIKRTPLLVFGVSKDLVYARNTRTNEDVQFHPNEISSYLVFLLPLIQGIRGEASNQETLQFAELITVLKNELIRTLNTAEDKSYVTNFILQLLKASVVNYFAGDSKVTANLELAEHKNTREKGKKYSEVISSLEIRGADTKSFVTKFLPTLNNKCFGIIKSIFLYDFSRVDSEILGSLIYRIVSAEAGIRSHMVSEENSLKIIGPMLIEPFLVELTRVESDSEHYKSLLKNILELSFLDPTNGTGNLLATAMNKISTFAAVTSKSDSYLSELAVENFIAINDDPIGAEISRIIVWFTYVNIKFKKGSATQTALDDVYRKIHVIEDNPLEVSWKVTSKETLPNVIFGVPTFKGWHKMSSDEKDLFNKVADTFNPSNLDYSAAWLIKASRLIAGTTSQACFGLTNSLIQGQQVKFLWPNVFDQGVEISFAYPSFKWINDSKQGTGVTAVVIGIRAIGKNDVLPTLRKDGRVESVKVIGPYLVPGITKIIESRNRRAIGDQLPHMVKGNMPYDDGNLLLNREELESLLRIAPTARQFIKRIVGSDEFINSIERYCVWIPTAELPTALAIKPIAQRVAAVRKFRSSGKDEGAKKLSERAHQFREFRSTKMQTLVVPSVSSENRRFIPIGFVGPGTIVSNLSFAIYECQPWVLSILSSSIHMIWATTTCGKLETRIRYSSHLCYNTFPLPALTQDQQMLLTKLAFDLISCRERFPGKSLGDLYSEMPVDLEIQHRLIDQCVDGVYGLQGLVSGQDRLRKLLEIYEI